MWLSFSNRADLPQKKNIPHRDWEGNRICRLYKRTDFDAQPCAQVLRCCTWNGGFGTKYLYNCNFINLMETFSSKYVPSDSIQFCQRVTNDFIPFSKEFVFLARRNSSNTFLTSILLLNLFYPMKSVVNA